MPRHGDRGAVAARAQRWQRRAALDASRRLAGRAARPPAAARPALSIPALSRCQPRSRRQCFATLPVYDALSSVLWPFILNCAKRVRADQAPAPPRPPAGQACPHGVRSGAGRTCGRHIWADRSSVPSWLTVLEAALPRRAPPRALAHERRRAGDCLANLVQRRVLHRRDKYVLLLCGRSCSSRRSLFELAPALAGCRSTFRRTRGKSHRVSRRRGAIRDARCGGLLDRGEHVPLPRSGRLGRCPGRLHYAPQRQSVQQNCMKSRRAEARPDAQRAPPPPCSSGVRQTADAATVRPSVLVTKSRFGVDTELR
jgi:hypothetical protein